MKRYIVILIIIVASEMFGQQIKPLQFKLNENGTSFFQVTFLNQVWLRFNESNPGTLVMGNPQNYTFDIGLRRTRIQMIGQIHPRVFLYFQFGMNNFNPIYNSSSNRKLAVFFHDALCEYRFFNKNELKIGAGLTIANGLSRFSQPSISSIATMDVPIFAQTTVDQTDQFSRKLSVYLRGQLGKLDYRVILSDPFPVSSNGQASNSISLNSNFALKGHTLQAQGLFIYQFFDHEPHQTPYMSGTYLGDLKIFNLGAGFIYQPKATWRLSDQLTDTLYDDMKLFCVESFLDLPIGKDSSKSVINAYIGYFYLDYGKNYLRYNGIMNPGNGTNDAYALTGQGPTYGNSFPMFGTGHTIYTQLAYLLPKHICKGKIRIMPYSSAQFSFYQMLGYKLDWVSHIGVQFLILGHKSKISLDWQNRPSFYNDTTIKEGNRKNQLVLQYQIFF